MNGVDFYRETAVTTQNKGRLVVMLYDGAIKFLRQAIVAIEANDFLGKGRFLIRAQDIIVELNTTLEMEADSEIAKNLRALYNFIYRRLSQANTECDPKIVREVIGLLEELNSGWKTITV